MGDWTECTVIVPKTLNDGDLALIAETLGVPTIVNGQVLVSLNYGGCDIHEKLVKMFLPHAIFYPGGDYPEHVYAYHPTYGIGKCPTIDGKPAIAVTSKGVNLQSKEYEIAVEVAKIIEVIEAS